MVQMILLGARNWLTLIENGGNNSNFISIFRYMMTSRFFNYRVLWMVWDYCIFIGRQKYFASGRRMGSWPTTADFSMFWDRGRQLWKNSLEFLQLQSSKWLGRTLRNFWRSLQWGKSSDAKLDLYTTYCNIFRYPWIGFMTNKTKVLGIRSLYLLL